MSTGIFAWCVYPVQSSDETVVTRLG